MTGFRLPGFLPEGSLELRQPAAPDRGHASTRWRRRTALLLASLTGAVPAAGGALAQTWSPTPAPMPASGDVLPAAPAPSLAPTRVRAGNAGLIEMAVRRLPDAVEVIIAGVGPSPQLLQTSRAGSWEGRLLVTTPTTLRRGPQRLSLPEAGLQLISIEGAGSRFALTVTPVAGYPIERPVVSADGSNLILSFRATPQSSQQSWGRDLSLPGRVASPESLPPLQPRAVAPPVGDMAVGSMLLRNPGFVNVSGPPVNMTLNNASASAALMSLARMGGYGFVFVNDAAAGGSPGQARASGTPANGAANAAANSRISISFRNEEYSRALNSTLLAAGLQGKLEGNTLLVGSNVLGKTFGAQLSKVYRLNQVAANSAADYLANLGAQVTKTNTITTAVSEGVASTAAPAGSPTASTTTSSTTTNVEAYGATSGPLLGLRATTDSRLSTITLVGPPSLVSIAENYLRQLDLRQRQVALSVKILDVNLRNNADVFNSFAFRWGNNFIVNENGTLAANFGALVGGSNSQARLGSPLLPEVPLNNFTGRANPGLNYTPENFYDFLQARVFSENSKVIASPTLILQEDPSVLRESSGGSAASGSSSGGGSGGFSSAYEDIDSPIGRRRGNEGVVRVGVNVPTNVTTSIVGTAGISSCSISQISTAGLVLGARVQKIDDNGFITFSLSPSISAVEDEVAAGAQCPPISILRVRRLDTGLVRVRDGQTLILTGVISDFDRAEVSKWPILGDIPVVGQFFRASTNMRDKRELVIMVTPRIIDDSQGGSWGYGYQPASRDSRRFLGNGSAASPF